MDLERRDAGQRARGRPDLGGEVRQRDEVVADQRGGSRKAVARELYTVARIAREADDDPLLFLKDLAQIEIAGVLDRSRDRVGAPLPPLVSLRRSAPAQRSGLSSCLAESRPGGMVRT